MNSYSRVFFDLLNLHTMPSHPGEKCLCGLHLLACTKCKFRSYDVVLNNWTEEEFDALKTKFLTASSAVIGKETGEEGTPHLQCFVRFKSQKTPSAFKTFLDNPRCNFRRVLSEGACSEYCAKDGDKWTHGEFLTKKDGGKKEKRRWQDAFEAAKEGRLDDIPGDIALRQWGNIQKIAQYHAQKPVDLDKLDFWWFQGPTGTGKSRTARLENPDFYNKLKNKWWDNYRGEPCVIIEEWGPNDHLLVDKLKQWLDHYSFTAEVKGGTVTLRPPKIIITSNFTLEQCFPSPQDLQPLRRRLQVREFGPIDAGISMSPHFVPPPPN